MSALRAAWVLLLLAAPAFGKPGWAGKPDRADEKGHVFVCEGQGANEEDAAAAAQGICNDKICKVCGVEVESIVETRETLTGVDLQRKVVERCRRVRKSETKVRSKSTDCDPSGCTAWIEIFYPREDEKAECSAYTNEDFSDPAACEKDIQVFRAQEGRTAEAMKRRTFALDRALVHCAKIDVRPTPAMLAIDEKLRAGLAQFEWGEDRQREVRGDDFGKPWWGYYLAADPAMHQRVAESKLLLDRIRLVRDLVANKALVVAVVEAAQARDLDSPAGLERLRAAMDKAPVGRQYGAPNVHFGAVSGIDRFKSPTAPVADELRKLYAPASIEAENAFIAAKLFADDGQVTQPEWDWVFAAHQKQPCVHCLRTLLQAPDHGGPAVRLDRALQALPTVANRGDAHDLAGFTALVGYSNPALALELEPKLDARLRAAYSWKFMEEFLHRFDSSKELAAPVRAAFLRRAAEVLAAEPDDERNYCTSLAARVKTLQEAGVERVAGEDWKARTDKLKAVAAKGAAPGPSALLDGRVCACLTGVLRDEVHLANRDDLLQHANARGLACATGLRTE